MLADLITFTIGDLATWTVIPVNKWHTATLDSLDTFAKRQMSVHLAYITCTLNARSLLTAASETSKPRENLAPMTQHMY